MVWQNKDRSHGEVSEWSMVRHWKCRVGQPTAGSNPVLSANTKNPAFYAGFFVLTVRTKEEKLPR